MLNENQKKLAELFKTHRLSEKELYSEEAIELLAMSVAYVANVRPNLDARINNPLSLQEMFALILLALGRKPIECAEILGVSYHSLHEYERRARKKLGANDRTNAFYLAMTKGYLLLRPIH